MVLTSTKNTNYIACASHTVMVLLAAFSLNALLLNRVIILLFIFASRKKLRFLQKAGSYQ